MPSGPSFSPLLVLLLLFLLPIIATLLRPRSTNFLAAIPNEDGEFEDAGGLDTAAAASPPPHRTCGPLAAGGGGGGFGLGLTSSRPIVGLFPNGDGGDRSARWRRASPASTSPVTLSASAAAMRTPLTRSRMSMAHICEPKQQQKGAIDRSIDPGLFAGEKKEKKVFRNTHTHKE